MKTKLPGMLAIFLGVFLCAGVAAASDVATLQPASDITYNENVTIKGSLNTDSLRVGTVGQGGVTFFNGTVLNEGPDPFTVGDDLKVDGEIWRGVKGGEPLKISDNVIPTVTNIYYFGNSSHRWKEIYAKHGNFSGNLTVNGVTGLTDADIPNNITASNYLPLSGGSITGNLTVSGKIKGNLNIEGNIAPTTNRAYNIGTKTKKYEKLWTDQADIRQNSVSQLFFYNTVTEENEGYIADAGDDYSIGISGQKGNILLSAKNGTNPASLELAENTTLKFTPRNSHPYGCDGTKEGEIYYNGSMKRFYGCDGTSWKIIAFQLPT